jgi:hypothetical protein
MGKKLKVLEPLPTPDEKGRVKIPFGVDDRLGRGMGYIITKSNTRAGYGRAPEGLYFSGQVSRNGFGHQSTTHFGPFADEAARDAKIQEVVASARKRALSPSARLKS